MFSLIKDTLGLDGYFGSSSIKTRRATVILVSHSAILLDDTFFNVSIRDNRNKCQSIVSVPRNYGLTVLPEDDTTRIYTLIASDVIKRVESGHFSYDTAYASTVETYSFNSYIVRKDGTIDMIRRPHRAIYDGSIRTEEVFMRDKYRNSRYSKIDYKGWPVYCYMCNKINDADMRKINAAVRSYMQRHRMDPSTDFCITLEVFIE